MLSTSSRYCPYFLNPLVDLLSWFILDPRVNIVVFISLNPKLMFFSICSQSPNRCFLCVLNPRVDMFSTPESMLLSLYVLDPLFVIVFIFSTPSWFILDPDSISSLFFSTPSWNFLNPQADIVFVFSTPKLIRSRPLSRCCCLYIFSTPQLIYSWPLSQSCLVFTFSSPRVDIALSWFPQSSLMSYLFFQPPRRHQSLFFIISVNPWVNVDLVFQPYSFVFLTSPLIICHFIAFSGTTFRSFRFYEDYHHSYHPIKLFKWGQLSYPNLTPKSINWYIHHDIFIIYISWHTLLSA